ncbi:integrase [Alicyclobacillaceae bacterium I2511]|nr:integrase [Alicyclobacillaceae bacterium I2511]
MSVKIADTASGVVPAKRLAAHAHEYIQHSKSRNTIKAYQSDWRAFAAWCALQDLSALPANEDTVTLYLTHMAESGHKTSTIGRHMISIGLAHKSRGYTSPTASETVKAVWRGIRNTHGVAVSPKAPILVEDLRRMIQQAPPHLLGLRDRSLLLIGFAGAFRRSELVSLDVDDATFTREGLTLTLRRSKTDQEGAGRKVGIPYGSHIETCPVRTLEDWLQAAGLDSGPLFRRVDKAGRVGSERLSDKTVARVVKKYAVGIGLNERDYAGHSLRAGLATSAAMAGASERAIMAQTGHKSVHMVRRYIREGSLFRENAAAQVGL